MIGFLRTAASDLRHQIEADRELVRRVKTALQWIGYDAMHLVRVVPFKKCSEWLEDLDPTSLEVLEIGSGEFWQSKFTFKSYTVFDYPEFDICRDRLSRQFDLVIADNVFEHLASPFRAARNVLAMLKPGGWFLNITPFLIKIHAVPIDCTRWTELGMRNLLAEVGFRSENMHSGSWGNRRAIIANLKRLGVRRGWRRYMKNERDFPATVWVMAQRPVSNDHLV